MHASSRLLRQLVVGTGVLVVASGCAFLDRSADDPAPTVTTTTTPRSTATAAATETAPTTRETTETTTSENSETDTTTTSTRTSTSTPADPTATDITRVVPEIALRNSAAYHLQEVATEPITLEMTRPGQDQYSFWVGYHSFVDETPYGGNDCNIVVTTSAGTVEDGRQTRCTRQGINMGSPVRVNLTSPGPATITVTEERSGVSGDVTVIVDPPQ